MNLEHVLQSSKRQNPQGFWRYGVRVRGIKKRGRKVDWHVEVSKGLGESTILDENHARVLALEWIAANMKSYDQAFAMAYFWTVENGSETWQPMNDDHNIRINLLA